jgi:hypothetical protein
MQNIDMWKWERQREKKRENYPLFNASVSLVGSLLRNLQPLQTHPATVAMGLAAQKMTFSF